MAQNPLGTSKFEQPDPQEVFELRREVEQALAYEPINSLESPKPREEVGQTVVDAANSSSNYLDQLVAAGETESLTPEQKLVVIGMNIQAMRNNALKEGNVATNRAAYLRPVNGASSNDDRKAA